MRWLLVFLTLLATPAWAIDRSQFVLGPEPANAEAMFQPEVDYMVQYQAAFGMITRCEYETASIYNGQLRKAQLFLDAHHFMAPAEWGPGMELEKKYKAMEPAQCQQAAIRQAIHEAKSRIILFSEKINYYNEYQKNAR